MASTEKIIRYVGVDFGTSASAVFFKDYYEDGQPTNPNEPEAVSFGRFPTVPTLVLTDDRGNDYFGENAERKAEEYPELLRSEFKMDLVKTDAPNSASEAQELAQTFLRHLYETYRQQATTMQSVRVREERYLISYPAKWPAPVREMTVEAARKAGFEAARGTIEPEAAMRYFSSIRTDEYKALEQRGVIVEGRPLNVLLIDMGAGTTDLVLYRYTPGGSEHSVLDAWPPVDIAERGANLGGREIDQRLFDEVIKPALPEGWLDSLDETYTAKFKQDTKRWKEDTLSPVLREGGCVDKLPSSLILLLKLSRYETSKIGLDRKQFESLFKDYLELFSNLVDELIDHAKGLDRIKDGEDIDLVILTGGHSQWYWVEQMLAGKLAQFSRPALRKIRDEPGRILKGLHPQETVARGMAMTGMPVHVSKVASNNVWLKIKLGETDIEPLPIQEIGDSLPSNKQIYRTADYQFGSFDNRMPGKCALVTGETLAGGKVFEAVPFAVPYKSFIKRLFQWFSPGDKGRIYLMVDVDEDERYALLGLVQSAWSEGYGYFAINRRAPNDSERRKLFEAMKRHTSE